jgi:hypothetical protein
MTNDDSQARLGGACSMLVGVSYLLLGVLVVFQLPALRQAVMAGDMGRYLELTAQTPGNIVAEGIVYIAGAALALAVVPAVAARVGGPNPGWVGWASTLALIGFAVTLISNVRAVALEPMRAAAYVAGDASTRAALAASVPIRGDLDPQGWLAFGAVGFWVLVVSWLALRARAWHRLLAYIGLALGAGYLLAATGFTLHSDVLVTLAAGLAGAVLAPIWYIWLGLTLRRKSV